MTDDLDENKKKISELVRKALSRVLPNAKFRVFLGYKTEHREVPLPTEFFNDKNVSFDSPLVSDSGPTFITIEGLSSEEKEYFSKCYNKVAGYHLARPDGQREYAPYCKLEPNENNTTFSHPLSINLWPIMYLGYCVADEDRKKDIAWGNMEEHDAKSNFHILEFALRHMFNQAVEGRKIWVAEAKRDLEILTPQSRHQRP